MTSRPLSVLILCTRDGSQCRDQHHEGGPGRDGIRKQGKGGIIRQALGHDATANDGHEQEECPDGFGKCTRKHLNNVP